MAANKVFYLFPGQGSQYRGMGSDLVAEFPAVERLYAQASDGSWIAALTRLRSDVSGS